MSRTTLEFTVSVYGEEATLKNIKKVLTVAEKPVQSPLKDVLAEWVKKKLTEAGVTADFRVALNEHRIVVKSITEGGLNPQEWLDKDIYSDIPQFGQDIPEEEDFQD